MIADPRGIGMTSQRTRDRLIQRLQERGIQNIQLLTVMRQCPRHLFVDEALASRAYEDTALPIGLGQTISQPYIVARMTEILLQGGPRNKVLEIIYIPYCCVYNICPNTSTYSRTIKI